MGIKVQLFGPSRPKANYPLRHRYVCLRPTIYVRIFHAYSFFPYRQQKYGHCQVSQHCVWFSFNVSWKQGVSCSWASLCQTHPAPSAPNNLRDWLMILVSSADSIGRVWHEMERAVLHEQILACGFVYWFVCCVVFFFWFCLKSYIVMFP